MHFRNWVQKLLSCKIKKLERFVKATTASFVLKNIIDYILIIEFSFIKKFIKSLVLRLFVFYRDEKIRNNKILMQQIILNYINNNDD